MRSVYRSLIQNAKGEVLTYGLGNFEGINDLITWINEFRESLGIKARIICNESDRKNLKFLEKYRLTSVKFLPVKSTSFYSLADDMLVITIPHTEPVSLIVKNKHIALMMKQGFELQWSRKSYVLTGKKGIEDLCKKVIEEGKDLYLIGANAEIFQRYKKMWREFEDERIKKGIKRFHLAIEETRNLAFNKGKNIYVKYLPDAMKSPHVIWIFGKYVAHVVWRKEETVFLIEDSTVATSYKNYFRALSSIARD